jgi:hypothetical protein
MDPWPVAVDTSVGARCATTNAARHAEDGTSAAPVKSRISAATQQATSGKSLRMTNLAVPGEISRPARWGKAGVQRLQPADRGLQGRDEASAHRQLPSAELMSGATIFIPGSSAL